MELGYRRINKENIGWVYKWSNNNDYSYILTIPFNPILKELWNSSQRMVDWYYHYILYKEHMANVKDLSAYILLLI